MKEDVFHLGIKALVRERGGNVLLMRMNPRHTHGGAAVLWDLPGGRVERGATVEETLRREVAEEIGVKDLIIGKHLGMVLANVRIPQHGGGDTGLILSIYECRIPENADIAISEEHTTYEWCIPKVAAARLATKFPPEFCERIASL